MLSLTVGIAAAPAQSGGGLGGPVSSKTPPAGSNATQVYPIRGGHSYWRGFEGESGHEGVDVGARCGTPLVSSLAGRVRWVKYHGAAGNYLTIDARDSNLEIVYMHMRGPAIVKPGQSVYPGQPVGLVGDTGNASGCHLHFEVWEGTYYGGGAPVDPMPFLESWDRARGKRASKPR